ncbi:endonuclease domain-containing protein [Corynebacterium cystitidis]|uniref:endonuclease domain-containing protein n=1 Tax=Corynebacterium cystitidis TaxID=35757 RepID=UPI00211E9602|nr:endonuclease domain-containing protein [Corynebacterium cystitidis]
MRESFTREQLAAAIVDTRTFRLAELDKRKALAAGTYRRLHASFYILTEFHESLFWHEKRAVHAIAVGLAAHSSVLVGRSAARVTGMWVVSLGEEAVELSNPNGNIPSRQRRQPGLSYHGFQLLSEDIDTAVGVKVTVPPRTAVDVARLHGYHEGLIACDWVLANGFTKAELREAADGLGRVRGIRHIRHCIEHAPSLSQSSYESLLRSVLIDEALTQFRLQAEIGPYYVDILLLDFLVIEVDGSAKYNDDATFAEVRRKEMHREKYIRNLGYWVLRFTPHEIRTQRHMVIKRIRESIAEYQKVGSPRPRAA